MFSIQSYYRNDILILKALGYEVLLSNTFWDFFCFWKYNISFLYFYRYSLIPAFLSKLVRKKVYFTGGIDYLDKNFATKKQCRLQAFFFRLCNFFSDGSILVSSTDVENVSALYGGKLPDNCRIGFHSIDVESFVFEGNLHEKKNQFCTIAWLANIDNMYRKGVDKAVKLFAEIVKLKPDSLFYIVGTKGEGSDYLLSLIQELNIQNKVIYLGSISESDKITLLKECKYYFQLSTYEGFGIAAIEALAAGCLVIHSGRGGLKDAVGEYGFQVDIDNFLPTSDLLQSIEKKSADNEFIGDGIKYVRETFSMNQRMNLFSQVIK
jgi:glycosyltransferase involved in cell wall biosynthesis